MAKGKKGGDGGAALPRELLVMRHAKSDRDPGVPRDFDRPLNDRGRGDAPRMALWMRREGLVPDRVVASPAARARETAELVVGTLGLAKGAVAWEERLYEASLPAILAVLAAQPAAARRVLLVAHNPGLEDLVAHLGGDSVPVPPDGKLLVTAAVAHFAMPERWDRLGPGAGRLRELVRPKELEE
jgi:phosphohistidine phosphatase